MSGGGAEPGAPDLDALCADVARLAGTPGEAAASALVRHLMHPSWYLRERVVEALGARADGAEPLGRVLREGPWWGRASACDVIARRADASRIADLLAALEAPNVSLQKSAVRALAGVARQAGVGVVAAGVAALEPDRRRRVTARVGHQSPHWAAELEAALREVPSESFAPPGPPPPAPRPEDEETRTLVRFRRWLRTGAALAPRRGRRAAATTTATSSPEEEVP